MRLKFLLSLVAVTGFLASALAPSASWGCETHEVNAQFEGATRTAQAVQATVTPVYPITVRAGTPADQKVEAVRRAGQQVSEEVSATGEAKLAMLARRVQKAARSNGEAMVAVPLSIEFGIEANELATQCKRLDVSWGDLMIAHTLLANSQSELTIKQVFRLREEGMSWIQIAVGLGLEPGQVVDAVRAETKVAMGQTPADGKVAMIVNRRPALTTGTAAETGTPTTTATSTSE